MESVRQSCRPKHQVLTLKCYPRYQKGVPEVKPNPSELSYLLYYASTRRSKLTKVGAFLEKRVAKDVWRRRLGNVQVALHILTALIEKLPRELPIYARYVLTVIETILRSNDISLVEDSIETFETFCRHQDIATIAAEQDIAHKYREVVRIYASFAEPSSATYSPSQVGPPLAIRWKTAGLRAIKSVVGSESLAADGGTFLKIIIPVILDNLYSPDEDVLVSLKARIYDDEKPERDGARNRRTSVTTVCTVDTAQGDPETAAQSTADVDRKAEMDARLLALRCLEQIIVSGSHRGQIRVAATKILQFIANKRFAQPSSQDQMDDIVGGGNWATSLVELVANWCPVQVRFVILMAAMDTLLETNPREDALDSAFTILTVVDWLLKSSINMIGLSVMDILLGLMNYASNILSPSSDDGAEGREKPASQPDNASFISPGRRSLLTLLETCIGDLATHIYYGDQVADMMRAILRRFKPTPNQDSAAPSILATVHEAGVANAESSQSAMGFNSDKTQSDAFPHTASKLTALRAVKAVLVVANLKAPAARSNSETRNQVGIHVWEGTQGLLRDHDQDVRFAYADAFLSWLQFETDKSDLKVRVDSPKYAKPASKRDSDQLDKSSRRSTSVVGNQREKVALVAQSTFLGLLHLAIYDSALEAAAVESEVLLLHLLLASLVDNLGANAVQFGLPMVLKLQDDLFTSIDLGSVSARVNIGTLVHGYLLAVSEKFDLKSSRCGIEIHNEVEKRQSKGQWCFKVRLPPTGIDGIAVDDKKVVHDDSVDSTILTPFRDVDSLVSEVDESYRKTVSDSAQSPPTSPAKAFSFPVSNHVAAQAQSQPENGLPSSVKEQMLSSWSRDACLAAVERESVKTLSLSGSRGGTLTRNGQINSSGIVNGSPVGSASFKNRRMSVPEISHTPEHSSDRGSPVRVTELRRVLSVNNDSNPRRLSPLRSQIDPSNISVISSGSESLISGAYSVSEIDGDAASIQPREGQQFSEQFSEGEGIEMPPASASASAPSGGGASTGKSQQPSLSRMDSQEIPPVPPIPATLNIPGGFPNDSQPSLLSNNRPSTAPDASQQSSFGGKFVSGQGSRLAKSLNRDKSRSSNHLASGLAGALQDMNGPDSPLDKAERDELKKLLHGFLAHEGSQLSNGEHSSGAAQSSKASNFASRRHVSGGGIGRPPY